MISSVSGPDIACRDLLDRAHAFFEGTVLKDEVGNDRPYSARRAAQALDSSRGVGAGRVAAARNALDQPSCIDMENPHALDI